MTERDGDLDPVAEEADAERSWREARVRADLEALQKRYGPPQPRDPQRGQLALPIAGTTDDDDAEEDDE